MFHFYARKFEINQFVIFKPLSHCSKETIGLDVKSPFAGHLLSRLIKLYNTSGDITKKFWEKPIHFHETFYGLKITSRNNKSLKMLK